MEKINRRSALMAAGAALAGVVAGTASESEAAFGRRRAVAVVVGSLCGGNNGQCRIARQCTTLRATGRRDGRAAGGVREAVGVSRRNRKDYR